MLDQPTAQPTAVDQLLNEAMRVLAQKLGDAEHWAREAHSYTIHPGYASSLLDLAEDVVRLRMQCANLRLLQPLYRHIDAGEED